MDKIKKFLSKHVSLWHKEEVEGLVKYYDTHGAKYTELTAYPQITNPIHPWSQKREKFSKKYGSEFSKYDDEIYFTPKYTNFTLKFKIPKSSYAKKHLVISDKKLGLNDIEIEENRPAIILSSIAKIKAIPELKILNILIYCIRTKINVWKKLLSL